MMELVTLNVTFHSLQEKVKPKERLMSFKKNDPSTCRDPSLFEYALTVWDEKTIIAITLL